MTDQTTTAAATTTETTDTTAATTSAPWYKGVADDETIGHWQNRGLPLDDPHKLSIELTKQYRNLEKFSGVPPDKLIKLPDNMDAKAWRDVMGRLGAPKEASEYDFSGVKVNGSDLEQSFSDAMRSALFDAALPKDKASAIVGAAAKWMEGKSASEAAELAAKLETEKAALAKSWGQNFDMNRLTAMQGAQRLGVDAETVALLEQRVGYAKVMEMFRKVGAGTSEDSFKASGHGPGQVVTQEGAKARLAELQRDKEWGRRLLAGDVDARREFDNLTKLSIGYTEAA